MKSQRTTKKFKKPLTTSEISYLSSLPEEKIIEISQKMTTSQKEQICQLLSTPKIPDWIQSTIKLHKETSGLTSTLPSFDKKKDLKNITEMIMISAGDSEKPKKETVKFLHNFIKDYLIELSNSSKKELNTKFKYVIKKYKPGNKNLTEDEEAEDQEFQGGQCKDLKSVERLEFNDFRTSKMDEKQYFVFSDCRKASFLKYGKEMFINWIGCKRFFKILSWIGREKIFDIVENANRRRSTDGKLQILETPLTIEELVLDS